MSHWPPAEFSLPGGGRFVVRTAEERDAPEALRHAREIVFNSPHSVTTPEEFAERDLQSQVDWIREHRDDDGKIILVAELDGRVIGLINFRNHSRRRMAHHGHFGIGVDESCRGKGVGRALILSLLAWARAHPVIEKVCLGVFANNTGACRLYRSLGFQEEGRRQGEFKMAPGVYIDDIQMSLWVKPR